MKLPSLPMFNHIWLHVYLYLYVSLNMAIPERWRLCVSVSPRFDFATKKGGNETDAKLADPIAGAESRSCGLPGSDFCHVNYPNPPWSFMNWTKCDVLCWWISKDTSQILWTLWSIMVFITRWKHMEKSEHQICEDKHLTTSNMVLSENGVYPNMASVGKMVP